METGLVPVFAIEGGLTLALTRGLFVASLLAAFGTALFAALVAPRALARGDAATAAGAQRRLSGLLLVELIACPLAALAWLLAQAGDMAGAATLADAVSAIPPVLADTAFGHLLLAQLAALAASGLALRPRPALGSARFRIGTSLLGIATALQAGHGHAWAMYGGPSGLLLAGMVHVLAAGGWLGGLVPLLLIVRDTPPPVGAAAARWYSPLGKWCVAGIVGSSAWQFWQLIGGLPGLVGTAYGWIAGLKLALFGVLFGFALLNRYRFAPALLRSDPERAWRRLVASIAVQSGFGVLVVLAAGILSNLQPAMHEQPIWPFPERFSLDAVREDPGFRGEVIEAAMMLAGAALALVVAWPLRRRLRWAIWPAIAAASGIAWLAVPHLGLLLVPAEPTYYWRSPTGFAATAVAQGATLYPQHCATCHGAEGRGDGPAAKGLPVPPADLTAAHLWMHSDGQLYWWLTHGIEAPEGGLAMPGFAGALSAEERWDLIDYVRAHNAGLTMQTTRHWSPPIKAPGFDAACGARTITLADLRGRVVRLVFGTDPPLSSLDVVTVLAAPKPPPGSASCVVDDESVPRAYAIVTGLPAQDVAGTQVLIDGDGWLRALWRPGPARGWDEPGVLAAEVRAIRDHPIGADADHAMAMPMGMNR